MGLLGHETVCLCYACAALFMEVTVMEVDYSPSLGKPASDDTTSQSVHSCTTSGTSCAHTLHVPMHPRTHAGFCTS